MRHLITSLGICREGSEVGQEPCLMNEALVPICTEEDGLEEGLLTVSRGPLQGIRTKASSSLFSPLKPRGRALEDSLHYLIITSFLMFIGHVDFLSFRCSLGLALLS